MVWHSVDSTRNHGTKSGRLRNEAKWCHQQRWFTGAIFGKGLSCFRKAAQLNHVIRRVYVNPPWKYQLGRFDITFRHINVVLSEPFLTQKFSVSSSNGQRHVRCSGTIHPRTPTLDHLGVSYLEVSASWRQGGLTGGSGGYLVCNVFYILLMYLCVHTYILFISLFVYLFATYMQLHMKQSTYMLSWNYLAHLWGCQGFSDLPVESVTCSIDGADVFKNLIAKALMTTKCLAIYLFVGLHIPGMIGHVPLILPHMYIYIIDICV